jgi:hypothetical protein
LTASRSTAKSLRAAKKRTVSIVEDVVEPERWQQETISDHESEILAARILKIVGDDKNRSTSVTGEHHSPTRIVQAQTLRKFS